MQGLPLTSQRQAHLDGVRGVAIVLVLIEHFGGLHTGRLGVDTFFVLSGLLMSRVLFEDKLPLRRFYQNRIARIFPVFYLYLAVVASCAWWQQQPPVDWNSLASAALYLRSYWPPTHIWTGPLPLGNLWSLNVEEHAYVVLSLAAWAAVAHGERAARWGLTALSVGCVAAYLVYRWLPVEPGATPPELRTECAALPLLLSAALFLWGRAGRLAWLRSVGSLVWGLLLLSAGLAVTGALPALARINEFIVLPCLLALGIHLLQDAPPAVLRALSTRWLTWLGLCSFSLYIWHYPFFYLDALNTMPVLVRMAGALLLATLSFYAFEQPMRRWIRRW
ncbi:MAG: acyltransferase [Pseudomonadota bacterium]